jgi:hypothetical protein
VILFRFGKQPLDFPHPFRHLFTERGVPHSGLHLFEKILIEIALNEPLLKCAGSCTLRTAIFGVKFLFDKTLQRPFCVPDSHTFPRNRVFGRRKRAKRAGIRIGIPTFLFARHVLSLGDGTSLRTVMSGTARLGRYGSRPGE